MSRVRRILCSFLPGRRSDASDGGFSLIEVIVALGLLVAVMATTAGFFTTSLKQSNGQTQAQEAAVLADQQLDYTRSVPGKSLLSGRTSTVVANAIANPPVGVDLSQDITATGNYDTSGATTQSVPLTMNPTVNGTKYTITTFIDQCYLTAQSSPDCKPTVTSYGWVYRITVDVTYSLGGGRSCANNKPCYYVASTLRDPGTDPCFNVNVAFAGCSTSQPTITSILPGTVTTNSATTITLGGTNFDPGATVDLDTGGTVSSITVNSSTSLTFTLTTDNTAAAVGTRTVKVTNPNGKFAYGTMTITTTAISATSVTPSPIYTSSTNTLTINGSGFEPGFSVVSLSGSAGTITSTNVTANAITLGFTATSTGVGTWPITITNPDGNSASVNLVINKAPVTLTAISPSTLAWGSTRSFTLTGTGFNSGAQVTLDGAAVTETWISSTSMTVSLTSDPSVGTHTFAVTNPDGGNASKTFTVTVNPMTVTSVSPSVTLSGSTKNFTINGTGFMASAVVKLDGTTVSTTSITSTAITLTLGSFPAIGSHTFTVTNPDGGTASTTFTVAKAHISSASPTTVVHSSSTSRTITLTGTNFVTSGSTTPVVTVNGVTTNVSSVSIVSTTSVTFAYRFATAGSYSMAIQVTSKDGSVSDIYTYTVTAS